MLNRRSDGFSLVEVLAVVLIIGILSAVFLPLGTNLLRIYETRTAAQLVATGIQAARLKAVSHNVTLGVVFVPGSFAGWPGGANQTFAWVTEDDANKTAAHCPVSAPGPSWSVWGGECGGGQAGFINMLSDPAQSSPKDSGVIPTVGISFVSPTQCIAPNGVAFPAANEWGIRFNNLGAACGISTNCPGPGSTPIHLEGVAPPYFTQYIFVNPVAGTFPGTTEGDLSVCIAFPLYKLTRWVTVSSGGRILVQP
jgi:prepilin-type N-terminal cleavage/methylation domain-containing protein